MSKPWDGGKPFTQDDLRKWAEVMKQDNPTFAVVIDTIVESRVKLFIFAQRAKLIQEIVAMDEAADSERCGL